MITRLSSKNKLWEALTRSRAHAAGLRGFVDALNVELERERALTRTYREAYDELQREVEARVIEARASASKQIAALSQLLSERDRQLYDCRKNRGDRR